MTDNSINNRVNQMVPIKNLDEARQLKPLVEKILREGEALTQDLIKQIAMDIGKEVVDYVERMYPQAVASTSSTFKLSLRNCIHNEIMAAIQVNDEGKIIERLEYRKKSRRWLKRMSKVKTMQEFDAVRKDTPENPAEKW